MAVLAIIVDVSADKDILDQTVNTESHAQSVSTIKFVNMAVQ
jgi:hypothetical protein